MDYIWKFVDDLDDTKKVPVIRTNGNDFEGAGNVCVGQPGSLACRVDEGDCMVNGCVLHGEVWARN